MKYFVSLPVLRVFQSPCSNFILNVALQLTLSSGKICTSAVFSNSSLNLTLPDASRISKADYSCKSKKKKLEAPWRILFFGTDEFSVKSLHLLSAKYQTHTLISKLEVVSSEKGKHSPVIKFAKDEKLVLHHWPVDPDIIKDNYDIGIVVSFGHLIPSKIIDAFPLGMINVHGSILPRWRGAAPIVHAILSGDHETGISIIRIRPKHFDRGEIVRQYRCPISPHDTAGELHTRLAEVGGQLLLDCVRDMPRCVLNAPAQPEEGATYAKKIDASYSLIDWNNMSSVQVYNLHRALGHVYPLLTQWNGVKVKLHNITLDTSHQCRSEQSMNNADQLNSDVGKQSTQHLSSALSFLSGAQSTTPTKRTAVETERTSGEPGLVTFDKENKVIRIKCIDGKSVLCSQITVSGKKKMSAVDFSNGFICKVKNEKERRFVNLDKQFMSVEKS
uniref:Methionyl-tRNA formyltransferase, mitochondrial n=2 Tax=Cacopsylla melanoneura TaxID=428564 RepID=A0A8D8YHV2_9HEMI